MTGGFSPINDAARDPGFEGARRGDAYNPCMFHAFTSSLQAAAVERVTLLLNHVMATEPVFPGRLRAHEGRAVRLQLDAWPPLLPTLPQLCFRVTPAGLFEWCGNEPMADVDLRVRLDAANPALAVAQWATGEPPRVEVQGDAQLAADLSWVAEHLRWDVQDDLARIVGQAPAHELARVGRALAGGLREAAGRFSGRAASRAANEPRPGSR